MIAAYTSPTANCRRVTVMLEACGLAYQRHRLDRAKREHKTEAYLAINPAGQVPAIFDRDGPVGQPVTIAQGGAILIYLAEKTGQYLPLAGAARYRVLAALMQAMTDANPASSLYYNLHSVVETNQPTKDFIAARLQRYLGQCDAALANAEFLAGDLSIADFALLPIAARRRDLIAAWSMTHLQRWLDGLTARPDLQRGLEMA
jgi:GSH-dependent disulfide-bond oxidoreductase